MRLKFIGFFPLEKKKDEIETDKNYLHIEEAREKNIQCNPIALSR